MCPEAPVSIKGLVSSVSPHEQSSSDSWQPWWRLVIKRVNEEGMSISALPRISCIGGDDLQRAANQRHEDQRQPASMQEAWAVQGRERKADVKIKENRRMFSKWLKTSHVGRLHGKPKGNHDRFGRGVDLFFSLLFLCFTLVSFFPCPQSCSD